MKKSILLFALVAGSFSSQLSHAIPAEQAQIVMGSNHVCVLDTTQNVRCLGDNTHGQLNVPNLSRPTQLSAAKNHTCALDANGVHCWGENDKGAIAVPRLNHPTSVATGPDHSCAITADGIKCWGNNDNEQCDPPSRPLRRIRNPIQLAVGEGFSCALEASGKIKCWGRIYDPRQDEIEELSGIRKISAGKLHLCAVDAAGKSKCIDWYPNNNNHRCIPDQYHVVDVSSGEDHSCFLKNNNALQCIYFNPQTGVHYSDSNYSYRVSNNPQTLKIASGWGWFYDCALTREGVFCGRGNNSFGLATRFEAIFGPYWGGTVGTSRYFRSLAEQVYAFDQNYFTQIADLIDTLNASEPTGAFALHALIPHLQNIGYPGIAQDFVEHDIERMKTALAQSGFADIQSVPSPIQVRRVALQLLVISINTSQPVLSSEQKQQAPLLLTLLANALSTELRYADLASFMQQIPDLERFFTEMSQNSYLRGRAASALAILEYLKRI